MQRLFLALGALCVFLLSVGGIVLLVRHQRQTAVMQKFVAAGPATLAREEAAARALGIPLTPAAKQAPLPPPSQNAAPLESVFRYPPTRLPAETGPPGR